MKTARKPFVLAVGFTALVVAQAPAAAQTAAPRVVRVNCTRGESVQAVVSRAAGEPVEIQIRGFCPERVVIRHPNVTLRGISGDPELDGITGLRPDGSPVDLAGGLGLVLVEGVETGGATATGQPSALPVHLWDLGIRDSSASGLVVTESGVGLTNVRAQDNAGLGVYLTSTSFGIFHRLIAAGNGNVGLRANRESLINCGSCELTDNGSWAVVGSGGGRVALYDAGSGPTVTFGPRGVQTFYGGRVWLYPGTDVVATDWLALWAVQSGAIEAFGASVDGAVWCGLNGELYLVGLEQRSNNGINNFYTECAAHFEGGSVAFVGSTLFHTHASGALFDDGTASFEELACQTGGDFVCYGPVSATSTNGCSCP